MIAYFGAQILWLVTCFLANGVILLFALAFNLNLLTGNGYARVRCARPDIAGDPQPVHEHLRDAVADRDGDTRRLLGDVEGAHAATVHRDGGALAVSFIYFLLAIGIVTQPEKTIAPASKLSNELSTALLVFDERRQRR